MVMWPHTQKEGGPALTGIFCISLGTGPSDVFSGWGVALHTSFVFPMP